MQSKRLLCTLLVGLLALTVCCRRGSERERGLNSAGVGSVLVENSGAQLSGEFELKQLEDSYRAADSRTPPRVLYRFNEDGSFQRERSSQDRPARIEDGSYLIGTTGELVLFVEKVNGEFLESARVERYLMTESGNDELRLQRAGTTVLLARR
jgi:hypothetical protein